MAEPIWKSIMTIHLIRYYLIYRFSYGKKLYFSSADDEGTGITCTYTKGKNGFKLERSKMVLTERSGRYAVGYICMIVYTIL